MNDLNLLEKYSRVSPASAVRIRVGRAILFGCIGCMLTSWMLFHVYSLVLPTFTWAIAIPAIEGFMYSALLVPPLFFSLLNCPMIIRLVGAFGCMVPLVAADMIGISILNHVYTGFFTADIERSIQTIPLAMLSIAAPFLILKTIMGWHIVIQSWSQPLESQHLTVRGLLVFTMLVAMASLLGQSTEDPFYAAAACCFFGGLAIIPAAPITYVTFRSKTPWRWIAIATLTCGSLAVVIHANISDGIRWGSGVFIVAVTIYAMRLTGCRLVVNSDINNQRNGDVGSTAVSPFVKP